MWLQMAQIGIRQIWAGPSRAGRRGARDSAAWWAPPWLQPPHHHLLMELSRTNHNTMTGDINIVRIECNFRVVGHFGAVQWMNLQLSPTTTITIFITKSLLERAGGVSACP